MANTWTGRHTFRQDGKHLDRLADVQTGYSKYLYWLVDIQKDEKHVDKLDSKHLDRLADIQKGWKTLGQAGRCSNRIANT
jgi:hypothetical protein